jgi:hypothetical protein
MMKIEKIFLSILFVLIINGAAIYGKDNKIEYKVSAIPANLLKDADAIIRKKIISFEIKSSSKAIEKITEAVTIFNQDGRDYCELELYYDPSVKIKNIEGQIYDENGNFIKELDEDEIKDYSAVSNYSLFEDYRVKTTKFYTQRFPYTVEFKYERVYNGYIHWPSWIDQESLDAVEYSKFEIILSAEQPLRYWCSKPDIKPVIKKEDDVNIYTWEARNLEKLSKDIYGNNYEDYATVVYTAPAKFEIENTNGDMTSWKNFGMWYSQLSKGRNNLSQQAISEVKALVKPTDSDFEKIGKVYKYMQSRTRYVSIQLGLGKWQPFDAQFVHDHGYGDCKALSNYMVTLLQQININAYQVLIKNGSYRYPFLKEFPNQMFNHVIACVPLKSDTLWLECTSSIAKCGEIGSGNENRQALMIKDGAGEVVNTPTSTSNQNKQSRSCTVSIKSFGAAEIDAVVKWSGNQTLPIKSIIENDSPDEKKVWITKTISVPDLKIKNYNFIKNESGEYGISLKLQLDIPRYATVSSNRIFFQANIMEKRTSVPAEIAKRFSPVRMSFPYLDTDTIRITLPDWYNLESLPAEINLNSSFGSYHSKTVLEKNETILFIRTLEMKNYSIPPEKYSDYRKFFQDVVKADRAMVVLVKK